jgi:hypothetical protein
MVAFVSWALIIVNDAYERTMPTRRLNEQVKRNAK